MLGRPHFSFLGLFLCTSSLSPLLHFLELRSGHDRSPRSPLRTSLLSSRQNVEDPSARLMLTWPGLLLCHSTVNFLPSYAFSQSSRSPVPATVLKYLPVHDCVCLNGPFPFLGVRVLTDRTLSFTCQGPHCQLSALSLVVPLKLVCIVGLHSGWRLFVDPRSPVPLGSR